MEYELALKLKEAGFKQDVWKYELNNYAYCALKDCYCHNELHLLHKDNDEGVGVGNDYQHRESNPLQEWVKAPTISELIKALGDGFVNLYLTKGVFHCVNPFEDGEDITGSTPEEAVANLWLELNKK
jgi:hypothetical protein